MNVLEKKYSSYWRNLGTVLTYQRPDFQFRSSVIITDIDDCLLKPLSAAKIYNTVNKNNFEIYSSDFIKKLQKECQDHSIIILSNQVNSNGLNIDIIKRKVEKIVEELQIPVMGVFAITPNCFMKPHTGMWRLLNAYYKKYGNTSIQKAVVVSDEGGFIIEDIKKNGMIKKTVYSDVDRAFAHNINTSYKSIDEFLEYDVITKFGWDQKTIDPDTRQEYIKQIKKITNPNIPKELGRFGNRDIYIIMIMGAPRSGKTTLAKDIVARWRKSPFGYYNEIYRLGMDKYTNKRRLKTFKKTIDDRISIILDGGCHTDRLRKPYLDWIKNKDIPLLCIEVNCGLEMAKVFNHAHVEESPDDTVTLYKNREYNIYKSMYNTPFETDNLHYIMYVPTIQLKPSVINFRY
jgi:DNA 3'-phosphatase